jgi:hypothetical protein
MKHQGLILLFFSVMISYSYDAVFAQAAKSGSEVDKKVTEFLKTKSNTWHEWNVPESDGRLLYDIIVKHNYKNAVARGYKGVKRIAHAAPQVYRYGNIEGETCVLF